MEYMYKIEVLMNNVAQLFKRIYIGMTEKQDCIILKSYNTKENTVNYIHYTRL